MDSFERETISQIKERLLSSDHLSDSELTSLSTDSRTGVQSLYRQWQKRQEKKLAVLEEHQHLLRYEHILWSKGMQYIAGIDEVGRGPLAGPVVAAAVILPPDFQLLGLTDSKKLSASKRELFFEQIKTTAVAYGIGAASAEEIDQINIYQATKLAMTRAVQLLKIPPQYLLIDAMTLETSLPQKNIIKGDANSLSIAAASVMAKVTRDRLMADYHQLYPEYKFDQNAGYGTKDHLLALKKYGAVPIHRKTFAPVRAMY